MKWSGPAEVVGTTSNWIFTIRNLITQETREVHASRLKFYVDASLNVTAPLLEQVAHNSEGHVVDRIDDHKYDRQSKQYKFHIRWRGLSNAESSWEPIQQVFEDVGAVVRNYLRDHEGDRDIADIAAALGVTKPDGTRSTKRSRKLLKKGGVVMGQ